MTCDSPHHFAVERTEHLVRIRSPRLLTAALDGCADNLE